MVHHNAQGSGLTATNNLHIALCDHCHHYSLWREEKMIYPLTGSAPAPNPDIPDDIKADYEEARAILVSSPRGAAALLRLVVQKLCIHLGEKGKKIDDDISSLVKKGLMPKTQKALDTVRVIGNNAVHPGKIDLNDTPQVAHALFVLVNVITDVMISQPKQIDELYATLPESSREAIARRDGTIETSG
jgi:hypothetical protein